VNRQPLLEALAAQWRHASQIRMPRGPWPLAASSSAVSFVPQSLQHACMISIVALSEIARF
jgi:hypothetical protein